MEKNALIRLLMHNTSGVNPSITTVAEQLQITSAKAGDLKNQINNDGIFKISSGKGGGLSIKATINEEKDIYKFIDKNVSDWIKANIYGRLGVTHERLAPTHGRKFTGKWRTPDFTFMSSHKFLYASTKIFEITTIEVKHSNKQFEVSCVYEALAHTRASTYSILFFYDDICDSIKDKRDYSIFEEIKIECARLGIGLVVTDYPCDPTRWQYLIPAIQHQPDPRRVEEYIEEVFEGDEDGKKWLKSII